MVTLLPRQAPPLRYSMIERPRLPRAFRDSRFRKSVAALSLIDSRLESSGRLPTAREILGCTGGSMRDVQRIHAAARAWLEQVVRLSLTTHSLQKMEALHEEIRTLRQQNNVLSEVAAKLDQEYDGLRRHLLLETSRLRDELEAAARIVDDSVIVQRHLLHESDTVYDSPE
jgi:hypothetical protein